MSKRMKYAIILVMAAAIALGSLTASAGIYDAYKLTFGEARWQTKYNNLVDTLGESLTSFSNLITGWAPVANQDILLPVAATYSSGTTFTVPGDYTSQFAALAKVRVDLGSGTLKGSYVASSSYGAGVTTVILHDSILTNPISGVWVTAARNGLWPYGNGEINALDYAEGTPSLAGLQAAIAAIGANERTLRLPSGTWPITDDLTIPANVTLRPERGAILSIATTKTLAINGTLEAGLYQIFTCTGTGKAAFGSGVVKEFYPEWWGGKGDGTTDNYAAIQAAIIAAGSVPDLGDVSPRAAVIFGGGSYVVDSCINGTNRTGLVMRGTGRGFLKGTTILGNTGAGKAILDLSGSVSACIEGITFQGGTSTIGIITAMTTVQQGNAQLFRDVCVSFGSTPAANDGVGTIGIVCVCNEVITFDHLSIYADAPVILSSTTDLSWFESPGANTLTVSSDYATLDTLSQGVATFVGSCSLVGYHTRPPVALYGANTVDLGNTYIGTPYALAGTNYTAIYIGYCSNFTWNGHAENFNTLMEIPGTLINAKINARMTPYTDADPILNMNPYTPGVTGGSILNGQIHVDLPAAATIGCFASSTDATHPNYIDNVVLSVYPWDTANIATIKPNANLLPKCRNVRVQVLGGSYDYFGTGTWTPVIEGSVAAGVGTYAANGQVGKYTRQGNVVTATATLICTAHTGTGDIVITGLPYAASADTNIVPVGSINPAGLVYTKDTLSLYMLPGATSLYPMEMTAGDAAQQGIAIPGSPGAIGSFNVSITYLTD